MSDVTAAIGVAQVERRSTAYWPNGRAWRALGERLSAIEGVELPCEDAGAERRSWFVYVVQLPDGADRDGVIGRGSRDGHRVQGATSP